MEGIVIQLHIPIATDPNEWKDGFDKADTEVVYVRGIRYYGWINLSLQSDIYSSLSVAFNNKYCTLSVVGRVFTLLFFRLCTWCSHCHSDAVLVPAERATPGTSQPRSLL